MSGTAYLWIKALHLIAVISWMAGLFYLPRLFIYHTEAKPGSEMSETFKVMERRLLRAIMHPAMAVSLGLGLVMLWDMGLDALLAAHWLHVKLLAASAMLVFHWKLTRWRIDFVNDSNTRSQKFYRYANEVPTLLMIVIVIMVIVKP